MEIPTQGSFKNIVVCCDGTWSGYTPDNASNIKILADCFAGSSLSKKDTLKDYTYAKVNIATKTVVGYFEGVGLSFSKPEIAPRSRNYLMDGALALDIGKRCEEAYEFIVDHYTEGTKIYLFGFSRGAFTVRSVAEMISKYGILRADPAEESSKTFKCEAVYRMYRNTDPGYKAFDMSVMADNFWPQNKKDRPIRLMGLLDTVGALGVPDVDVGFKLHHKLGNQDVPLIVQTVCQALALHDRMAPFDPTFVRRPGGANTECETEEVWFPGSHYDLGRQMMNVTLFSLPLVRIKYTPELSDPPRKWLIKRVKVIDPDILPNDLNDDVYANKGNDFRRQHVWQLLWLLVALPWRMVRYCRSLFDAYGIIFGFWTELRRWASRHLGPGPLVVPPWRLAMDWTLDVDAYDSMFSFWSDLRRGAGLRMMVKLCEGFNVYWEMRVFAPMLPATYKYLTTLGGVVVTPVDSILAIRTYLPPPTLSLGERFWDVSWPVIRSVWVAIRDYPGIIASCLTIVGLVGTLLKTFVGGIMYWFAGTGLLLQDRDIPMYPVREIPDAPLIYSSAAPNPDPEWNRFRSKALERFLSMGMKPTFVTLDL